MARGPLSGEPAGPVPSTCERRTRPAVGPLAATSLSLVQATVSAPIAAHSIRTFCYARLLAGHDATRTDAAYDEDLLFAACVCSRRPP